MFKINRKLAWGKIASIDICASTTALTPFSFFWKKSTNPLFLVLMCKKSPIATGNSASNFLEWWILALTYLLFVFTQLSLSSWLMLLAVCFAATDLLMDPSIIHSLRYCKLNGIDIICFSREKSPSNSTFSWEISCRTIWAPYASTILFSSQKLSPVSNKVLPVSPSSESNFTRPFLFSHNPGIDSNKQSLNLVQWIYLSTLRATRTCS